MGIRKRSSITFVASLVLAATTCVALTTTASAAVVHNYYVDCAAGADTNSGQDATHPWRSLATVDSVQFRPGDSVRFKAGTTCVGTFAPQGSGTGANPVVATSYGNGSPAHIDGAGGLAAIYLHDVQGWTLRHLDVTNTGPTPTATQQRLGIYVLLTDFGTGRHYTVTDVTVHDVNGCDCRYPDASGGIVFEAGGTTTPTGFDDVVVRDNTVTHVDRTGIATFSGWQRRAVNPNGPGSSFVGETGVVVSGNHLSDIGGDGVTLLNTVGAVARNNIVDGYNVRSADYNVGMYAYNSDGAKFAHNSVVNGAGVGIAYAFEGANNGTLYQYNYSANNGGGALYICNSDGTTSADNTFRYNISNGDIGDQPFLGVVTSPCGPQSGTRVFDNDFVDPGAARLVTSSGGPAVAYTNNIFQGQSGATITDPTGVYDHDLFSGVATLPANSTAAVVAASPGFAPSAATDPATSFTLATGSPALGAGIRVAHSGSQDYFGNAIPATGPNIGAYQGRGH